MASTRPTSFPFSDQPRICRYDTLISTSKTAAEAAKEGAEHLYTVVARSQTGGRGRLSRRFYSPTGGLYFTTVLRTSLTLAQYGAITPFAALAVRRAIARVCGVDVAIKWVNDLLLDGKKVCGILAESGVDREGAPYVLLGIGVNTGTAEFPPELQDIAAALPCPDTDALLAEILRELSQTEHAVRSGSWTEAYRAASAVLGKKVTLIEGDVRRTVLALDIAENGALLVLCEDGSRESVCGGEISLRLTQ